METINKLGEFLATVRKERNLSLKKVEAETQISASYINRLEKGNRNNPSIYTLDKLSAFYGIPPQKVMELAGFSTSTEPNTTASCQNLDVFLATATFLIIGGRQVSSKTFQLIVKKALDLNIDNFSEVMDYLNSLKEFQKEFQKELA